MEQVISTYSKGQEKALLVRYADDFVLFHSDKAILKKWLKAGYMEQHVLYPTEAGTPQGGLCKALHNPPYAKWKAMQSKCKKSLKLLHLCLIYFA